MNSQCSGLPLADVIGLTNLFVSDVVDADVVFSFGNAAQGETSVRSRNGAEIQRCDINHGALDSVVVVVEHNSGDRSTSRGCGCQRRLRFRFHRPWRLRANREVRSSALRPTEEAGNVSSYFILCKCLCFEILRQKYGGDVTVILRLHNSLNASILQNYQVYMG